MDVAIDPEDLIVDGEFVPQTRFRGFFLGKRVPYSLLKRAFGLPGKALAVYLALWVRFSITNRRQTELERKFFSGSGLAPTAITRGINELVRAGLVEEKSRKPGATPRLLLRTEKEVQEYEVKNAKY
mgnify:CR=1 FL=1